MRRYRVWHKEKKEYLTNVLLDPEGRVWYSATEHYAEKDVSVELSTGLKDENEREIFEGDVLVTPNGVRFFARIEDFKKIDCECVRILDN